jgi:hypothetical protein
MDRTRHKGGLERGAAPDLWRNTLSQISTIYGRLVYLATLRNPNTGKYEHHGLALLFGDSEADKALRKSHMDSFNEWLNFSLQEQKADVELYLSELEGSRQTVLENWSRLMPYSNLPPASARQVERTLFFTEVETILGLLRNEFGVSFRDPDA